MRKLANAAGAFVALMLGLALAGRAEAASEPVRVAVDAVAGLRAHLERQFGGLFPFGDSGAYEILTIDLDDPPDGIDEIVVAMGPSSGFCGSSGCEHHILRRDPDGALVPIFSIIAARIAFAPESTGGTRNLIVNGGSPDTAIAGKSSGAVQKTREAPATAAAGPFEGACRDGFAWSGGPADPADPGQGGVARYGGCGKGEPTLAFACLPDAGAVTLAFAVDPNGYKVGEPAPGLMSANDDFFPMPGQLSRDEASRIIITFRFDRHGGLLAALQAGREAEFGAAKTKIRAHLAGAGEAIAAMLAACPDRRRPAAPGPVAGPAPAGPAPAAPGPARAARFDGPCVANTRWVGLTESAAYIECRPGRTNPIFVGRTLVNFYCTETGGSIEVRLGNHTIDGIEADDPIVVLVTVDGREYPVNGIAGAAEFEGTAVPEFRLAPDSPVIAALKTGSRARIGIRNVDLRLHLRGSGSALDMMLAGCRR